MKNRMVRVSAAHKRLCSSNGNHSVLRIEKLELGHCGIAVVGNADIDRSLFPDQHGGEVVTDAAFRTLEEIHIAEDTAGAEQDHLTIPLVWQEVGVSVMGDEPSESLSEIKDAELCP